MDLKNFKPFTGVAREKISYLVHKGGVVNSATERTVTVVIDAKTATVDQWGKVMWSMP